MSKEQEYYNLKYRIEDSWKTYGYNFGRLDLEIIQGFIDELEKQNEEMIKHIITNARGLDIEIIEKITGKSIDEVLKDE